MSGSQVCSISTNTQGAANSGGIFYSLFFPFFPLFKKLNKLPVCPHQNNGLDSSVLVIVSWKTGKYCVHLAPAAARVAGAGMENPGSPGVPVPIVVDGERGRRGKSRATAKRLLVTEVPIFPFPLSLAGAEKKKRQGGKKNLNIKYSEFSLLQVIFS